MMLSITKKSPSAIVPTVSIHQTTEGVEQTRQEKPSSKTV